MVDNPIETVRDVKYKIGAREVLLNIFTFRLPTGRIRLLSRE